MGKKEACPLGKPVQFWVCCLHLDHLLTPPCPTLTWRSVQSIQCNDIQDDIQERKDHMQLTVGHVYVDMPQSDDMFGKAFHLGVESTLSGNASRLGMYPRYKSVLANQ